MLSCKLTKESEIEIEQAAEHHFTAKERPFLQSGRIRINQKNRLCFRNLCVIYGTIGNIHRKRNIWCSLRLKPYILSPKFNIQRLSDHEFYKC